MDKQLKIQIITWPKLEMYTNKASYRGLGLGHRMQKQSFHCSEGVFHVFVGIGICYIPCIDELVQERRISSA